MMPRRAALFGVMLILLGVLAYTKAELLGGDPLIDNGQPTALIPAGFGAALLLLGLVGFSGDAARKHAMHLAAVVALLGVLGGLYPPVKAGFDFSKPSPKVGVAMALACGFFLVLCILSFRAARMARSARPAPLPGDEDVPF